jgi:hypothetical protein
MNQDIHKYNMHPNLDNLGHTHLDAILKLTQDNTDLPVDPVLRTEEVDIPVAVEAAVEAVLYHRRTSALLHASTSDLEADPPVPVPDNCMSNLVASPNHSLLRNPSLQPSTI